MVLQIKSMSHPRPNLPLAFLSIYSILPPFLLFQATNQHDEKLRRELKCNDRGGTEGADV